jgi:hypothetical protein
MEQYVFIVLIVVSFLVRFFFNKSKEKKNTLTKKQGVKPSVIRMDPDNSSSKFDNALDQFSNRMAKEVQSHQFTTNPKLVTSTALLTKENEPVEDRFERFKVHKKKEHRIVRGFRNPQRVKDIIIASEVLRPKF